MRNIGEKAENSLIYAFFALQTLTVIYFTICWFVVIYKFATCDFEEPYKEEIIYFISIIMPPIAGVTAWF